jgi:hypothetical protein
VILVIVVLILAVVGVLALLGDLNSGGAKPETGGGGNVAQVDVTGINYIFTSTSGGAGCWPDASEPGDTVNGGQQIPTSVGLTWTQPFLGSSTCTVETVAVSTNGFSIASSNVPLIVNTGGASYLNIEIGTPNSPFNGVVTIDAATME